MASAVGNQVHAAVPRAVWKEEVYAAVACAVRKEVYAAVAGAVRTEVIAAVAASAVGGKSMPSILR